MRIVIRSDRDFTPKGKRRWALVSHLRGGPAIRWYVSGRIYRTLAYCQESLTLSAEWMANEGAADNLPQS